MIIEPKIFCIFILKPNVSFPVVLNCIETLFFMILYFLEFKQGNAANKEYMDGNRA